MGGQDGIVGDRTISELGDEGPETERATILADRYALMSLIGSGGMGAVYRARDLELDEVVALKMLNQGFDRREASLQRFRREVKLARRVTHKNVARTFDIGEHEGDRFLTMELIDGAPLSAYVRANDLPLARVVHVAVELCAGLSAAHAAGVVHRDLKPDNVMVASDDRIVITDFGIACAASNDPDEPRGLMIGTPAYMAPEQVEGASDVDARADIYALGTILYELVTGARAWTGESVYKIAAQKLVSPPPDPRSVRPTIPDAIADIILRCMAQDRAARFADANAVARALNAALAGGSVAPPPTAVPASPQPRSLARRRSVAVMPLRCDDPEDLHIGYGLADEIIDVLSGSADLRVRARGAAERDGLRERDPCAVGRALGVEVIVEGSVRRVEKGIRVTLRALSVADAFQLWARRYEVPLSEAFSIGDEAAAAVCEAVTLEFRGAPRVHSGADSAAIDLYMRARHAFHHISRESLDRAIGLFQQALARAPDDPRILAGLAMALTRHLYYFESETSVDTALATARRAVAAGPEQVEARVALASILLGMGDFIAATREAATALRCGPENPDALEIVARLLSECGRAEESLAAFEAALAADPARPLQYEIVRVHALLGRWEGQEALAEMTPVPGAINMYWLSRWRLLMWRRDAEGARAALPAAESASFEFRDITLAMLSFIGGLSGPEAGLADIRARSHGTRAVRRRVLMHQLCAEIHAILADTGAMLDALEDADATHLLDLLWMDRCPLLQAYRTEPRFLAVRASVARRAEAISAELAPLH